jgi:hypothetical protein
MLIHGLKFQVNWKNFVVGSSFFIPCLDAEEALLQIKRTTDRLGYHIRTLSVVEKGISGLRVWRIR